MPIEAYMTDKELEEYRRSQQEAMSMPNTQTNEQRAENLQATGESKPGPFKATKEVSVDTAREVLKWREPPKALSKLTPEYVVEFPPEESSPTRVDLSLRSEEEDALALTLVTDMDIIKKRGSDEIGNEEEVTAGKKMKVSQLIAPDESFGGEFGNFTMGYKSKKEAASKSLPPPSQ